MDIFSFLTNPIVDALAGGDIYGVRTAAGGGEPDPLTFTQATQNAEEWNNIADVGAQVTPYEDWNTSWRQSRTEITNGTYGMGVDENFGLDDYPEI